jgi:hypothetical protein
MVTASPLFVGWAGETVAVKTTLIFKLEGICSRSRSIGTGHGIALTLEIRVLFGLAGKDRRYVRHFPVVVNRQGVAAVAATRWRD